MLDSSTANQFHLNPDSPFKPLNNTSTSSSSHSSGNQHNQTPIASCMTKTSTLSSSPSSSTYYETPSHHNKIFSSNFNQATAQQCLEKVILRRNADMVNYANLSPSDLVNENADHEEIYEMPDHTESNYLNENFVSNCHVKLNSSNYLINSDLRHYELSPDDLCVCKANSLGAKLTLDCGVSLIVPEGAIDSSKSVIMYLGLCRLASFKPKLNDKSTLLSGVLLIGPLNLKLLKPVILVVDHSVQNLANNWSVTLHSNTTNYSKAWTSHNYIEDDSELFFVNKTESNFLLMTESLGRFAFTGESNDSRCLLKAQKHFRLVVFFSTSMTNNDFNMRIYCIDDLLIALQEILVDEKIIGGMLVEVSEPFTVSYSSDSLSIYVDELMPDSINFKYNVNKQVSFQMQLYTLKKITL